MNYKPRSFRVFRTPVPEYSVVCSAGDWASPFDGLLFSFTSSFVDRNSSHTASNAGSLTDHAYLKKGRLLQSEKYHQKVVLCALARGMGAHPSQ